MENTNSAASSDNTQSTESSTAFASAIAENRTEQASNQTDTPVQTNPTPVVQASKFNDLLGEDGKFVSNWTEKLPDGFKEHQKSLAKFNDPTALITSYVSLEKEFSRRANSSPKLPGETATDEDWVKYREAVGAPKDVKDYGLTRPEDVPEEKWNGKLAEGAATIAHKYGIPPKALHELVDMYNGSMKEFVGGVQQQSEQQTASIVAALKAEWGAESKHNFQRAERAAISLGLNPEDPSIGNNAELIKALVKVDSMLGEDKGLVKSDSRLTYKEQYDRVFKSDDYQGKNGSKAQMEAAAKLKSYWNAMQH